MRRFVLLMVLSLACKGSSTAPMSNVPLRVELLDPCSTCNVRIKGESFVYAFHDANDTIIGSGAVTIQADSVCIRLQAPVATATATFGIKRLAMVRFRRSSPDWTFTNGISAENPWRKGITPVPGFGC